MGFLWGGPQPFRALLIAVRISSMVMSPSRFTSPARHSETSALPRATLTSVRTSSIVTWVLPSQSPAHAFAVVGVSVGEAVAVLCGLGLGVAVGVGIAGIVRVGVCVIIVVGVVVEVGILLGVLVGVTVGINVGVCVAVGVAVGVRVGESVGVCVGVAVGVRVGESVGVRVGVAVGVRVGELTSVCVGVAVGDGGEHDCCNSKAPMSVPSPPGAFGIGESSKVRAKPVPRWSVVRPLLVPLSMAGLPQSNAMVSVGPPLSCSSPRLAFSGAAVVPTWSP